MEKTLEVTAQVANLTETQLHMVRVELGAPPGFSVLTSGLEAAKAAGELASWEVESDAVVVYLDTLEAGEGAELTVPMRPAYAVKAQLPASRAYLYDDPEVETLAAPIVVTVVD